MSPLIVALVTMVALLASGVISTVETAVSQVSRARVEHMAKEEDAPAARGLLKVLDHRAEHINLLVFFRTILDVTAAVFAAVFALEFVEDERWALVAAIAGVSLITFAVIGVFSRTMGKKNPYTISQYSAGLLNVFALFLGPIPKVLIKIGNVIAPGPGFRDGPYSTEVELREMVDIAQEHGVVEIEERRMIQSVFDLASQTARSVMVPRPEMVWIESNKTAGQATSLCVRSGFSRLPVIGETVDEILGVVYLKDLVQRTYYSTDGGKSVTVDEVMRPATFVPDSKNLDALLHEMQRDRYHIAMLVDEYGGIAGLISIEDILEEIVGEIADEYDDREIAPIERIEDQPPAYRVVSRLSLEDLVEHLREELGVDIEFTEDIEDQVDTVAGLIAYEMGRVPLPGTTVETCGLRLRADGGRDRRGRIRVSSVLVTVLEQQDQEED
ncbi:hemolysin family protein [Corynebacterium sp. 153RC1]|uniref:hemolysin family protein n=2 Tax=unclassified Corynebacterium TaxID=2624378 RepID=UPI00211C3357|nr:hemolysin family protein [Corynebacterium sp. 209RC1]MCQ9354254.1 hemolysin family protein [Corynebacterium sp. 1222RC1]MCQ9356536.1 hemolysin family protein [Corynebacterium sp. 122RC1]MCQ9358880.1 hemolysin family protein [Corynebacterium sp. 142RC1]MCQ9360488.1 hemolysin family protein [Corynebacterium sp. 153RC1]MCQ9362650.1 hemolysin family protein [Corynebacterium sp. 732RC1]MCQ9365675.1 hemolysin family protein [Corynebacterium sp. 70RC1]MCQ9370646.1 hemolysin family protein [Coryn